MEEARFSLNLRNSPDYDSGMLTIRADTPEDLRGGVVQVAPDGYDVDGLLWSFFQLESKRAQEFVDQWNGSAREADEAKKEAASSKLAAAAAKRADKGRS